MRQGYQNAKLNNARVEKLLGVATTRDLKVITTLAERWGA
jgi:endo-1,4-beta-mannosidase